MSIGERPLIVRDHLGQVGDHELEDENEPETLGKDVMEPDHVFAVQDLRSFESIMDMRLAGKQRRYSSDQ